MSKFDPITSSPPATKTQCDFRSKCAAGADCPTNETAVLPEMYTDFAACWFVQQGRWPSRNTSLLLLQYVSQLISMNRFYSNSIYHWLKRVYAADVKSKVFSNKYNKHIHRLITQIT